jgi:hypothetical protein
MAPRASTTGGRLDLAMCRRLLGPDCPLSDEAVDRLATQLYEIANVALDEFMKPGRGDGIA